MISIVIPCYNASQYLDRLSATISQISSFTTEVLLVDDGSTDDTFQQALALGLPIIQAPRNLGPGGARNFGVEHLEGEWVHFLDADDQLSPEALYQSLPYLNDSVDVLLVGARWVHELTGELLREWSIQTCDFSPNCVHYSLTSPIPTHCSILRIEQFRAIGGFDSELRCWEDGDLHVRLAAYGARFSASNLVLTTALRHDRGASANHLYCHRCRILFLKRYAQQHLPIEPAALANQFLTTGNLLLAECCYREAFEAFQLAYRVHPIQPSSQRASVAAIMALLPPPLAVFLQQWLRQTLGKFFRFRQ